MSDRLRSVCRTLRSGREPCQQRRRVSGDVGLQLAERRDQHPPLVHRTPEVAARDIVAIPGERERIAAQHVPHPGPEVRVRVRIAHAIRDIHADPADRVHQILEAGEPRQDVPVDLDAGQLFDGLHHEVRSCSSASLILRVPTPGMARRSPEGSRGSRSRPSRG